MAENPMPIWQRQALRETAKTEMCRWFEADGPTSADIVQALENFIDVLIETHEDVNHG